MTEERAPSPTTPELCIRKMSERGPRWSRTLLVHQGGFWSLWSTWSTPIHSDPPFFKFYRKCGPGWISVDQEDQGDHNPPWWTRTGFYISLMMIPSWISRTGEMRPNMGKYDGGYNTTSRGDIVKYDTRPKPGRNEADCRSPKQRNEPPRHGILGQGSKWNYKVNLASLMLKKKQGSNSRT